MEGQLLYMIVGPHCFGLSEATPQDRRIIADFTQHKCLSSNEYIRVCPYISLDDTNEAYPSDHRGMAEMSCPEQEDSPSPSITLYKIVVVGEPTSTL